MYDGRGGDLLLNSSSSTQSILVWTRVSRGSGLVVESFLIRSGEDLEVLTSKC